MPVHLELNNEELEWLIDQCRPYAHSSEFHANLFRWMEALQVSYLIGKVYRQTTDNTPFKAHFSINGYEYNS
jgi:hypothetical protein